ncbi:hypothetical protein J1N35_035455 [Gossypium stocksii]|uniref:Uncharacterized protein n=1 Tax=Gossypium stocksii TaxID=47602 RepID=A0A9D3UU00_9ROSI|nr:hypothetical protein J1N35_035455 [Gossypium stocksii]
MRNELAGRVKEFNNVACLFVKKLGGQGDCVWRLVSLEFQSAYLCEQEQLTFSMPTYLFFIYCENMLYFWVPMILRPEEKLPMNCH